MKVAAAAGFAVGDGSGSAPEIRKSEAFIAKGQGGVSGNTGGKGTPWPN